MELSSRHLWRIEHQTSMNSWIIRWKSCRTKCHKDFSRPSAEQHIKDLLKAMWHKPTRRITEVAGWWLSEARCSRLKMWAGRQKDGWWTWPDQDSSCRRALWARPYKASPWVCSFTKILAMMIVPNLCALQLQYHHMFLIVPEYDSSLNCYPMVFSPRMITAWST